MNSKKHYQLVPPDGGWAYMIWIAAIINLLVLTMFFPSIGMILNEYYIKLEMGSTDIQVQNGVNCISVAMGGFLTGPMMKVVSVRKLSFLGATSLNMGVIGLTFVNSFAMLVLCQGILMGIGTGMLYNIACTTLNDYFLEKRFMMTSLAQVVSAIAAIVAPLATHWTAENYGHRASIIFMASMYLQAFVGSALQQPVKWHMKRVPIRPETDALLKSNNTCKIQENIEESNDTDNKSENIANPKHGSVLVNIKNFFDWPFLKKFLGRCVCYGAPLCLFSDVMFTLFVPKALYAKDWQESDVAKALTLLSVGEILTKIVLTVVSLWLKKIDNDVIFIFGMVLDIAVKSVFLWFPHPVVAYVSMTFAGVSRCLLGVLFSLVISDAVPPEKYGVAFGVSVLMYGVYGVTVGPVLGTVRDATGNYELMFYLLNGLMATVTLAWCIELCCTNRRKSLNKASP